MFFTIDIETQKDRLRFVMCPILVPVFQGFFAAAINSTNEANKAEAAHAIKQSTFLRCLWFLQKKTFFPSVFEEFSEPYF
jgi:hypothetical protein